MPIELRKYQYNGVKNYFAGGLNRPTFVDKIIMQYVQEFPSYSEEFENEFDNMNFVFGDFSLKFHISQTERSTNNKSIAGFLYDDIDNHVIVCKVTTPIKSFSGFVDISKSWWNETKQQNRYDVDISCYSTAKELYNLGQSAPKIPASWHRNFNDYIKQCHFWTQNPLQLKINTDYLDWNTKVGFEPWLLGSDIGNNIFGYFMTEPRLKFPDQINEVTTWQLFEDLCRFFGIVYKFELTDELADNIFGFTMFLGFRSTLFGSNAVTIQGETIEHGFTQTAQANKYVYFRWIKQTALQGQIGAREFIWASDNIGNGVVFNRDTTYACTGNLLPISDPPTNAGVNKNELWDGSYSVLDINGASANIPIADVTVIDASYYFNPTTQEGDNNTHWSYGRVAESEFWSEPYHRFRPKNFSFPAMFAMPNGVVTLNQVETLNATQHQFFRLVDNNQTIYFNVRLIYEHCANENRFLLNDRLLEMYRFDLTFQNTNYKIFDTATIRNKDYALYKIESLNLATKRGVGVFKELVS